jgi:hypothetical protein
MFSFLAGLPDGRFQFEIGIQSTNPETLAAIDRRMDTEAALRNIRRLAALGTVHLHVDLILGLPFETGESFRRSFNQVFALGADHLQMGLLKVLPGTSIRCQADRFGLVSCEQPPYEILATRWLPQQELGELHALGECVESFHNNRYFLSLWRYLRRCGEEPYSFFADLLAVCRQHGFFELSVTQELLLRMLCELAKGRADRELLFDLLRYDWLGYGHRFLPPSLEGQPLADLRIRLRATLPPSMDGWYDLRGRSEFLKRGVFLEVAAGAGKEIGLGTRPAILCFVPVAGPVGDGRRVRVMTLDPVPAKGRA